MRLARLSRKDSFPAAVWLWFAPRRFWRSSRSTQTAKAILERYAAQVVHDVDRSERRCLDENRDFGAFEVGEWRGHYRKKRGDRDGGLTLEEVRALAEKNPDTYRFEPAGDAIAEWKKANRKASEGGPAPVAVILKRASTEGRIAFPRA